MKVKIGPYINWFGPYQFADLFKYIGFSEETCEKIAEKIPEKPFQYIYSLRKRKVKVKIDRYDVWSMDNTLALIILPMLKKLKESKQGIPGSLFGEEYSNIVSSKEYWDEKENGRLHKRIEKIQNQTEKKWNDIIDKMIWSFEQILDDSWEDQYWIVEPIIDWKKYPEDEGKETVPVRFVQKGKCDYEGMKKHQERIQEGLELFGKHYLNLWT